jgi:translation initiation factor eIF-2B subunit delta
VVHDYNTPANTSLSRDLDKYVRAQVQYLVECRQMCVGMGSVIKAFRHALSKLSPELSETDAKAVLQRCLARFTRKRIAGARVTIVEHVCSAISDGDTVLTFGGSAVVKECLLAAAEHTRFKVCGHGLLTVILFTGP